MRPLKIAICISGQSRTWKAGVDSFLHYFSSDLHDFKIFGHTWDENSWKTVFDGRKDYLHEKLDPIRLDKEIRDVFSLEDFKVDCQLKCDINGRYLTWTPMLKSAMLTNNLKTRYEINNDMTFDLVVHTRWDVLYDPNLTLEDSFPLELHYEINPTTLYCETSADFVGEYRMPAINDIMYFGSSRVMDIVDSMYHYYVNDQLLHLIGRGTRANELDEVGVGVLLHKWTSHKNILLRTGKVRPPIVIRKDAESFKWPEDYEKTKHVYINFGAV